MPDRYEFIVNPKSRSGMGKLIWDTLEPELKKRRVDYKVYPTERRKHAEKIVAGLTADGERHRIVVLGGDGTVNEVINGIRFPDKVVLGYIPIGSSNDFARGLKIPSDPLEALEIVLNPRRVMGMDIGSISRKGGTRRFAVSAGIGFDAAVCHEVCVSWWKKILNRIGLGKLSYAVVALDRLKKDRPAEMHITLDGGIEQIFENTYFAAFMNLPFEGGGFRFCPDASPEDSVLDIVILSGVSRLKALFLLPTAFAGKHVLFRGVTILRCRKAEVEMDRPMMIHTDGEPLFLRRQIRVGLMEEKLKVIVG